MLFHLVLFAFFVSLANICVYLLIQLLRELCSNSVPGDILYPLLHKQPSFESSFLRTCIFRSRQSSSFLRLFSTALGHAIDLRSSLEFQEMLDSVCQQLFSFLECCIAGIIYQNFFSCEAQKSSELLRFHEQNCIPLENPVFVVFLTFSSPYPYLLFTCLITSFHLFSPNS